MNNNFHVAIIMDGNGRWAQKRKKNRLWGHQEGARVLKNIIRACPKCQVRYLTVYAFSTENWKRGHTEVDGLMNLFKTYLINETRELVKENTVLKIIGNRSKLPPSLIPLIEDAEERTKNNTGFGLQIALNYGGRDDILHAVKKLSTLVKNQHLNPEDITLDHITQTLWTYPWPDPDLLIRTGGELRLSNYLLWQISYTELFFTPKCWPEFTIDDFRSAIFLYNQRHRQFGAVPMPSMSTL